MNDHDPISRALSRRHFLKATAATGIGLGVGAPALLSPARAAAPASVNFSGWAFEPQVVEANVKRFMEQNPDVQVNYTPLDLQLYNEKMVALFSANTRLAPADRRAAQARRARQGHLLLQPRGALLQGQAIRHALLR